MPEYEGDASVRTVRDGFIREASRVLAPVDRVKLRVAGGVVLQPISRLRS